ncbi:MAG: ADP-ribosylglycohydrolase family protein [Actinobacteria bacterium]|nr:ADP-ribosylglycohydrolase family protein [Actinomycetota bacterium]
MDLRSRYRGCLLGLAVGDAVGTTVEFRARGTFAPVVDMVGGGPFGLEPGQWTDDTSMALCLAASLIERGGFDARDQMRRYLDWWHHGYMSSTGECFDIGNTVRAALARFERNGDPFSGSDDPMTAGNGSLMRLAPIPLFFHPDTAAVTHYSAESSRTTHAAPEAIECCMLLGSAICAALSGASKHAILEVGDIGLQQPRVVSIAGGEYLRKEQDEIRGSGYCVASLEAALWCFARTDSFGDAVLWAANLGDDADTTAAIVGQIAGAHYGEEGIPQHWRTRVALADEIAAMAEGLLDQGECR